MACNALLLLSAVLFAAPVLSQTPAERAKALCANMTIQEKVGLLHGLGWGATDYVGQAKGVARLGVPDLRLEDGPQGFRCNGLGKCPPGTSTQYPSGLTIAATWDRDAAFQWGDSMGIEFFAKGANIQLGPGLCLARVPRNGRNFEYASGEDPILGRELVQPVVKGIQGHKVLATSKHYVLNNQETKRDSIDVQIDERTLYEMYLPPFKGAVMAGSGAMMCSYNRIGGTYACGQNSTLNTALRDHLGYKGFVMSDWRATHSTSILEGLDQEMPGQAWFNDARLDGIASAVDTSVQRVLTAMISVGALDANNTNSINTNASTAERMAVAQKLSENSTILLKNEDNILPLSANDKRFTRLVVVGDQAVTPITGGGGSGKVNPSYQPSPLSALAARGSHTNNCSMGNFEDGIDYFHNDALPDVAASDVQDCCQKCAITAGCNYFSFKKSASRCYLKETNQGRKTDSDVVSGACHNSSNDATLEIVYAADVDTAVKLAQGNTTAAIIFIGSSSAEGSDRKTLAYDDKTNDLVSQVAAVQPNTIVAAVSPGASLLPWEKDVKAILFALMPGQMYGDAITSLVFGDVSPSGKLPITIPNKDNEQGWPESQYPGQGGKVYYSEKLEVGYRWYDAHGTAPHFPFGHGLSYTTFAYSDVSVKPNQGSFTVQFTVTNNGTIPAAEVAQVYLGYPQSANEPPRNLRAFEKVYLQPGKSTEVTYDIVDRDLSIWDVSHAWKVVEGEYTVDVGSSSRDIRGTTKFTKTTTN